MLFPLFVLILLSLLVYTPSALLSTQYDTVRAYITAKLGFLGGLLTPFLKVLVPVFVSLVYPVYYCFVLHPPFSYFKQIVSLNNIIYLLKILLIFAIFRLLYYMVACMADTMDVTTEKSSLIFAYSFDKILANLARLLDPISTNFWLYLILLNIHRIATHSLLATIVNPSYLLLIPLVYSYISWFMSPQQIAPSWNYFHLNYGVFLGAILFVLIPFVYWEYWLQAICVLISIVSIPLMEHLFVVTV